MEAVWNNLGYMLGGLSFSGGIAAVSMVGSLLLGTVLAVLRLSERRWARYPAVVLIEGARSVPLVLFIFFTYFMIAAQGYDVSAFWSCCVALTIYIGAYVAEIVRGGIQSIDPGQTEAARATGLSTYSALRHIVLPQAVRRMMPALVSQMIVLIKDTSVATIIGVPEFFTRVLEANARSLAYPFQLLLFAAAVYFVICYSLSLLSRRLELTVS
ncbi:amino acid ABC transporter permease [Prauserella cavernicola]|uniref:Amino acid ABC transporter permease n=1 Tax=Prauserella cavernicola TaxID=2800127 RepID=A0A934V7D6_9PSEU|nr:amino acid ABC transporter permease [Prauserella cavernicola]MBK1786628.1 amino acid ABC transporter permease [Prauserella cavernicola]